MSLPRVRDTLTQGEDIVWTCKKLQEVEIKSSTITLSLSYIDRETKTTRTARAANFGTEASPWRLVLIDDWTRSLPHVLQGLMSIINTGTYNGFSLDAGSFIVATRNPEGEDYNVSGIDPAQLSRTIPIVYNTSEATFFEQLQAQSIDSSIMNFWMRHPELARPRQMTIHPIKEANCSRFRMLFSSIYEFIKYDQLVLNEVVNSMFGPEMLAMMLSDLRAEQPIDPDRILNGWGADLEKKINDYANNHQDVLTVTIQRLAYLLNASDTKVNPTQMKNVVHFMGALPQDSAFMMCKLLIDPGQPRRDEYVREIVSISESLPDNNNVVKMVIDLRASINQKLANV